MREIRQGMAFHPSNAYEKFWVYKREGEWNVIYPFRHSNTNLQGYRVPCETFEEALDELDYAVSTIK